jgi:delta24(24(1))-sterol reductase
MPPRSSSKGSPKASPTSRARSGSANPRKRDTSTADIAAAAAASPSAALTAARASERLQQLKKEASVPPAAPIAGQGEYKFTPEKDEWDGTYEFGGPIGTGSIMVISLSLIFYTFVCINSFAGEMVYPGHPLLRGRGFFEAIWGELSVTAVPTAKGFATYLAFLLLEWVFAVVMPGPVVLGRAVPSENGFRHAYRCNAVFAWWALLALVAALDYTNTWKLSTLARNYGDYLMSSVITGNAAAVAVYLYGFWAKRTVRLTGNVVYDFFMGSNLNPKLPLGVDFKMIAELRVSWAYLFLITASHAKLQYELTGTVTYGMLLLLLGHFLYSNACQKGEECVMTSWDIFYEKFGWMLIFWNLAGVPVFYGIQALFIVKVRLTDNMPAWQFAAFVAVLLFAYYIFDTANGQKNRFRMQRDGAPDDIIRRKTFPVLPWGFVENPRTIKGSNGREIFVDGWFRYARKITYTADSTQAFLWGASCGFGHFLPFLYWVFHASMLIHRTVRDELAMSAKYGPVWDEYVKVVPYRFIPFVY